MYINTDNAFKIREWLHQAAEQANMNESDARAFVLSAFKQATYGKIRQEMPEHLKNGAEVFVWRSVGAWCGCKRYGHYVQGVSAVIVRKVTPNFIIGTCGERVSRDSIIGFTID
jgi:hypothetical protein